MVHTSGTMTYSDIQNAVYFLTKTNSTSFPIAQLTIQANNALERVQSIAEQNDARWQFDDTNNTDLPIATTGLVTDQQDYSLTTAHLSITRVEIKDAQGNWILMQPFDQTDLYSQSLTDYLKASGMPKYYDKLGNSIFLYPKPNYTQAASLKLYFKRGPSYFTTADTTKTPGFNSLYHDLIPLWIAYNYSMANALPTASSFMLEIQRKEQALADDYALRGKDEHLTLQARQPWGGFNFFR